MLVVQGLAALVAALVVLQVLLASYLVFLTLATMMLRTRPPSSPGGTRRFAVLVPAHNEEGVIGRLLTSLNALEYPRTGFDICVVADNCDDATAAIRHAPRARLSH